MYLEKSKRVIIWNEKSTALPLEKHLFLLILKWVVSACPMLLASIEFPWIIHYLLYSCIVQRDSYSTVCISKNKKMHPVYFWLSIIWASFSTSWIMFWSEHYQRRNTVTVFQHINRLDIRTTFRVGNRCWTLLRIGTHSCIADSVLSMCS